MSHHCHTNRMWGSAFHLPNFLCQQRLTQKLPVMTGATDPFNGSCTSSLNTELGVSLPDSSRPQSAERDNSPTSKWKHGSSFAYGFLIVLAPSKAAKDAPHVGWANPHCAPTETPASKQNARELLDLHLPWMTTNKRVTRVT